MNTMIRTQLLVVLVMISVGACASSGGRMDTSGTASCAQPPSGVIRFALLSGADQAAIYEWKGGTYRRVRVQPTGPTLIGSFPDGSIYKWNYWGPDVASMNRELPGKGELSTPYAINRDGALLAAGLQLAGEYASAPRVALVRLGDGSLQSIIDMGRSVLSLAWSPTSDQLVVVTATERYGSRSGRERFSSAIGHPIPYSDITLSIVAVDGSVVCSISPAANVDYGNGYVRWDES